MARPCYTPKKISIKKRKIEKGGGGENERSPLFPRLFVLSSIFLVLTILTTTFFYKMFRGSSEKMHKTGDVIRRHVFITENLLIHEDKLNGYMEKDPTFELLTKQGLQPIQDRITSIKVQTSQYEKMTQIPGGPTSFIQSSLATLEHIIKNELKLLVKNAHLAVAQDTLLARQLAETAAIVMEENAKLSEAKFFSCPVLSSFIWLPENEEERLEVEFLADTGYTTINETIGILLGIAEDYERFENMSLKTLESLSNLGIPTAVKEFLNYPVTDEEWKILEPEMETLFRLREKMLRGVQSNYKKFQVFYVLRNRVVGRIFKNMKNLEHLESNKRRRVLELQTMIMKDVANLRIRITNLQFQYAKKKRAL